MTLRQASTFSECIKVYFNVLKSFCTDVETEAASKQARKNLYKRPRTEPCHWDLALLEDVGIFPLAPKDVITD